MTGSRLRKIFSAIFMLIIIISMVVGFCFSNDLDNVYGENYFPYDDGWQLEGHAVAFPYGDSQETFTITNTLPKVFTDQMLVMWVYYDNYEIFVDGESIKKSKDNVFAGVSTDAGKKEIWLRLRTEYSGKPITITMTLQKEIYGASITQAFITTRGEYASQVLKGNIMTMIVYSSFTVIGVVEIIIASTFAGENIHKKRKKIFKALLYCGLFAVFSAQWLVNDCRLPYIVFGHIVGFSIVNIVAFLVMPIYFFRMQMYLYERDNNKVSCIIDNVITAVAVIALVLALLGIINWGDLIYLAQVLAIIVLACVSLYSIKTIIFHRDKYSYVAVSLANIVFFILALAALMLFIGNVTSNYDSVFLLDLHIYVVAQICLIYQRISNSIKEERELAQTEIYAFSDELTKLGNRRKFYHVLDNYDENNMPEDFAIVMVDTNRLKYYNDTIGHEAGDELIVATANCLKQAFTDLTEANICRVGGDEFAISLVASKNEIEAAIANFKNAMKCWHGTLVSELYAGVGYATYRDYPNENINMLLEIADDEMYKDKSKFYENTGFDRRESR